LELGSEKEESGVANPEDNERTGPVVYSVDTCDRQVGSAQRDAMVCDARHEEESGRSKLDNVLKVKIDVVLLQNVATGIRPLRDEHNAIYARTREKRAERPYGDGDALDIEKLFRNGSFHAASDAACENACKVHVVPF